MKYSVTENTTNKTRSKVTNTMHTTSTLGGVLLAVGKFPRRHCC